MWNYAGSALEKPIAQKWEDAHRREAPGTCAVASALVHGQLCSRVCDPVLAPPHRRCCVVMAMTGTSRWKAERVRSEGIPQRLTGRCGFQGQHLGCHQGEGAGGHRGVGPPPKVVLLSPCTVASQNAILVRHGSNDSLIRCRRVEAVHTSLGNMHCAEGSMGSMAPDAHS